MQQNEKTNIHYGRRVLITYVTKMGNAFGEDEETGDKVYISNRIISRIAVDVGDVVAASVVENHANQVDETPWKAIFAAAPRQKLEHEMTARSSEVLDKITRLMTEDEDLWTVEELAEELGVSERDIESTINRCHTKFRRKYGYVLA